MKMNSFGFLMISIFAAGSLAAGACPVGLNHTPGTYTEVAVPCKGAEPDYSQTVVVNQSDASTGGECRVKLEPGEVFYVMGTDLLMADQKGVIHRVGMLTDQPTCTHYEGDYYSSWNAVRLD